MRLRLSCFVATIVACVSLAFAGATDDAAHDPKGPIVITHATVINPGTSSVQADRAVVVSGDGILSVSAAATFRPPPGARVIDATGEYLIPGLWDMHVHGAFGDWFPGGRDVILPLF